MFKLLKGGICYVPELKGVKDVLVVGEKIYNIDDSINAEGLPDVEVFDCSGKIVCPGFIDQHVHITGGGGEEGPASRVPEILLGDVLEAGVTTLVGVLGIDSISRSIADMLAKARALNTEGITAYIYTGSYSVPPATLTGRVMNDIALIDRIIGVGEIAIADCRSSHPGVEQLKMLASEARTGGLLGGKAGIMHIHVGDGREGLSKLFELVDHSDFPIDMFVPTHLNRNKKLFDQAVEYARRGGYVDLTAGESSGTGHGVGEALSILMKAGAPMENITVSSDGNGSMPGKNGANGEVGKMAQMLDDIRNCVLEQKMDFGDAIRHVTSNVAKVLKLYPAKGCLEKGSDADLLVLEPLDLRIDKVIAKGVLCVDNGKALKKGRFE